MGCLILLMSMIGPRVALVFVWLATGFIERAYDGFVVPALGFIFLPWTTLVSALVYDGRAVSPIGWFFVVLALVADLSSHAASARQGTRMRQA